MLVLACTDIEADIYIGIDIKLCTSIGETVHSPIGPVELEFCLRQNAVGGNRYFCRACDRSCFSDHREIPGEQIICPCDDAGVAGGPIGINPGQMETRTGM